MTSDGSSVVVRGTAPFLVWPVARREFYLTIQLALLPTLAWGAIVFGWRVLVLLGVASAAAGMVHGALKRFTRRGKRLVYAHSGMSAFILVALCHPMWPAWMVGIAGAMIPVTLWALGGPGRERIHVAVVWVVVLQAAIFWMPHLGAARGDRHGILARDRLLMGDIRNAQAGPFARWPSSVDLGGDDAVEMPRPEHVALETLNQLSQSVREEQVGTAGERTEGVANVPREVERRLDTVLATRLPSVEALMIGGVPGRIGTVSLAGILLGGLYLAYRHILRGRSVWLFLLTYLVAMIALAFAPATVMHVGIARIVRLWEQFPGELLTVLEYALLNGDVLFAAVFIMALPGTEPLTPRGRRVFVVAAALLAALLGRLDLNLPAASVSLCLLMPLASLFDRLFAKRSWLTRGYV